MANLGSAASISGSQHGIYAAGLVTVANQGSIVGQSLEGIDMTAGGTVTNLGTAAYISGAGTAIRAGGTVASTVINQGVISGGATAVQFAHVSGNLLRLIPGERIDGTVFGGGSAQDKLELAAGIKGGSVAGIGTRFSGFSSLVVDDGATWLMTGANTLGANYLTLTGSAELKVTGTLIAPGNFSIAGGGTLAAFDSGRIEIGSSGGARSGQIVVDAGHSFSPDASLAARAVVNRGTITGGADLVVASSLTNSGSITGDGVGVHLERGGTVINTGFVLGGSNGVETAAPGAGGAAVVVNQGTIGGNSDGVLLHTAGTVTNSGGTIVGAYAGVQLLGGGTVANTGLDRRRAMGHLCLGWCGHRHQSRHPARLQRRRPLFRSWRHADQHGRCRRRRRRQEWRLCQWRPR